jgi:TonB family protein
MKRVFLAGALVILMLGSATGSAMAQAKAVPAKAAQAAQPAVEAVSLTDDITPPKLREVATPEYTAEAKKKKIEGSVTLLIVVDKKGEVTNAKVIKGLGYGLDENAVVAVKEWRYKPAEKDGEPIAVKMEVSVDFFLGM